MEFITHRINTIDKLENIPVSFGVELDLRDYGDRLILNHDPFIGGVEFSLYLKRYKHGTMIINVKSEGIEYRALKLLKENHIDDFFFLDSSFPMIARLSAEGETRLAIRYSEYESIETVMAARGMAQWVWIDCFTKFPLEGPDCNTLKEAGFKICVVSPELQSREGDVEAMAALFIERGIVPDAVCTKLRNIERWRTALE